MIVADKYTKTPAKRFIASSLVVAGDTSFAKLRAPTRWHLVRASGGDAANFA
jgi:hypothetical protein